MGTPLGVLAFSEAMDSEETRENVDEDELTPQFLKTVIAITVAFLVLFGVITYIITFVILGF
jgi:hypothetical protein